MLSTQPNNEATVMASACDRMAPLTVDVPPLKPVGAPGTTATSSNPEDLHKVLTMDSNSSAVPKVSASTTTTSSGQVTESTSLLPQEPITSSASQPAPLPSTSTSTVTHPYENDVLLPSTSVGGSHHRDCETGVTYSPARNSCIGGSHEGLGEEGSHERDTWL